MLCADALFLFLRLKRRVKNPTFPCSLKVTLIGKSDEESISAELLAGLANTVNYEIVSRINENIPKIIV